MNRKLIFLDIDGTLTPAGSNIPPESAQNAIARARAAGHLVFLCSGRNRGMLSPVMEYGFDGAVASAGGYVYAGNHILFDCPMSVQERDTAMRLLAESRILRTIETLDRTYADDNLSEFLAGIPGGNSELVRWREAINQGLGIRPISEYDGAPLYKIVFMCRERRELAPVEAALGDRFQFVVQGEICGCLNGEMINRKFDKGLGVRILAEAFHANISDTIGFGDSMNDLEMIETVGTSVCMENGNPELKKKSDVVCPAVEDDGLARAFRDLGLA